MDFMIGCNYWDGANGTDMWRKFNVDVVTADIEALAATGVKYMRVFPNWRDFQPVMKLYAWRGEERGYCDYDENPITNVTGIDPKQIENFKTFADICDKNGIKLIVSVVTGWMSGRLFLPRALEGKDPINDPEVLMWTARFIKGFVNGVKDCKNIVMWDLGNECNSLGTARNRYESYTWTVFVRNAIYAADSTRPISSGMHGLTGGRGIWNIKDQGEITDYLTPHPYVSKTINNDIDPMNKLRTTLLPTAQCMFYSDISGKPVILQEQGGFSQALANYDMNADFGRINIWSALVHGVKGWLWWCGANHGTLTNTPYIWSMIERDLGMLDNDRSQRPVAKAIKATGERIAALPFESIPERDRDAVCVLTREQNNWDNGSGVFVLAKQAGFEITFAEAEDMISLPDAPLYIVPGTAGWAVMDKPVQDAIIDKVYNGATAFFSYDGSQMSRFEEVFGLRSHGIVKSNTSHTAGFEFGDMHYTCGGEILLESLDAEVLAKNEQGNIVFAKHKLGKGTVYFLNMPLERTLAVNYDAYNSDWYKLYRIFAKDIIDSKIVTDECPDLGITQHKVDDNRYIIAALNYSDSDVKCNFRVKDGWTLTPVQGNSDSIPKCDAAIFYADKK